MKTIFAILIASILAAPAALVAHHSFAAAFDGTKAKIDALKKLVCPANPQADVCRAKE